ncbi:MAG: ABC transporter ATP-binding protein [Candidatus Bathyarchaeia archaeon]
MAKVLIKNLTKRFGNVIAVNNLNLEIADKEFMVLLGPSGCGKTTTLRCIAGLEDPDEGEIYIGDRLVNDLPPKDRDVAMVFQSYALYPHMSVFDNIAFPLRIRKIPKNEVEKKVKEVADLLKISHLLNRKPRQLSGGERQRVALGRAIVRNPQVFLMDEPLSNLDAKLRVYMRAELKRLQKELGVTTIYVTHDQVEAMSMADRIAIMNLGVLQQIGTAYEVYNYPSNFFVAGFIGSPPMNFIDCTIRENNNSVLIDSGEFTFMLPDEIGKLVKEKITSSEIILGIRPEDIVIEKKCSSAKGLIEGEIYVTEPMGNEIIVDVKVGDKILKVKSPVEIEVNIGDKVWLEFKPNKIHLFDKRTEKTII